MQMMIGVMENEKAGNRSGKGWFGCYLIAPRTIWGRESGGMSNPEFWVSSLMTRDVERPGGLVFSARKGIWESVPQG